MAKFIHGSDTEETSMKRRPDTRVDELEREAKEKTDQLAQEYLERVKNGDYGDETFAEYTAKLKGVQQEFFDQLMAQFRPG